MVNIRLPSDAGDNVVMLSIRQHHNKYIINPSEKEVEIPYGAVVAGFGAGKWNQFENEEDVKPDTQFLFQLGGGDDLVVYNGALVTVQDKVVQRPQQQQKQQQQHQWQQQQQQQHQQ